MTKRRGHGEGSILQRADGRWVARIDLGYQGGSRRRKEFYGATRREVQLKLAGAQRAVQDGLPMAAERQTLGVFARRWLEETARPNVRPKTYQFYAGLLRLHIVPSLDRRPLAKVSPQDLQALYGQKLKEGLSPRTVGHIHRVLHKVLQDALNWGLLGRNPCAAVRPPRVQVQEIRTLSPDDARRFLATAEDHPHHALYVLAITAGLRQGELLGLKWPDVDLEAGRLRVQRTIQRIKGGGFVEGEPKSASSRRSITLTPMAVSALRRHRARQLEARMQAVVWEENSFLFPNEIGRPIEATNLLRRSFFPLLEQAGLQRLRFHDLRHTAATLLLAEGIHPKVVQEMLGHSTISLTLDTYSHVIPDLQREAAEKMQALLEAPKAGAI